MADFCIAHFHLQSKIQNQKSAIRKAVMPPIRTMLSCPQCRTPVPVNLEQLFDVTQDPSAKQRFLSGQFNLIDCPTCRYRGQAASILMYHDADKELLMSYVPMQLGLPQAEQEKAIGRLVNEVINKLPNEKRKGYLLNPKPALTLQNMLDRILEADGVTKEMVDAQKGKVQLLQKLLTAPDDALPALVTENDQDIDEQLFQILSASIQATAAQGNEPAVRKMLDLQNKLLELSNFGVKYRDRQAQVQAAVREMQELGDKLTPDKVMELILNADSEDKVAAYVSLARPAIDYGFFESLTRRIDRAQGEEKERLTKRRDFVLQLTQEIDEAAKARIGEAANRLKKIMDAPDLQKALAEAAPYIDETFMAVLEENIRAAQKAGRADLVTKLSLIGDGINRLIAESAPPEIQFINQLLDLKTDAEAEAELKRRAAELTPEVLQYMNNLSLQLRDGGRPELADRLEKLYESALGEVMAANWKKQ
jgi:hypothetical protein